MSIKSGVSRGTLVERRRQPFCEGWVEHKAHTKRGVRYRKLYMQLEQNVIYTFERTPPCNQNQLWNLTLDKSTIFKYRGPTKDHNGYKFDLFAGGRLNKFKTVRLSELEQWRGYIVGIITRTVPVDLDLLEDQIRRIVVDVRGYHSESDSGYIPDRPGPGGGSKRMEVFAHNRSIGSGDSGKGNSLKLDNSGQVVHRFHADKFGAQTPPSWFVARCSRAMAETVLRAAERLGYGNTLMRESTTHMSNGSYAISKLVRDKQTDVQFDHYEVIRLAGGYKLNVENKHEPMTCLTEVMHYFQRMFGLDTQLLTTNDRRQLQVEAQGEPSYVDRFRQHDHGEPEADGRCVPSPMPHMQHSLSAPGYVNQENERAVKEAQTLPVAPPPPRDPIVKGRPPASAAPHTPASPRDDKPSQLEQSLANVTLRKTGFKPTLSASPQQQQQQAYRLNVSKSVHSAIKSPDSPNKILVSQTKRNVPQTQKVTNAGVPSVANVSFSNDNGDSGEDGRASGGVGTLLKRFEVKVIPQSTGGEKPVVKKDKKVQFQQQEQRSVDIPMTGSVGRLHERRQSVPAMSAQNIKQRLEGLNPEFKSRLENMIGGAHTVAAPQNSRPSIQSQTASLAAASPIRSLPPTPHDEPDDHIYEALPDEVIYYNDSGHGSV